MTSHAWLQRFLEHTKDLGASTDRQALVESLADALLDVTRAHRVHVLLMEGDTVAAESHRSIGGDEGEPPPDMRKRAARVALAAARSQNEPGDPARSVSVELSGNHAFLSFVVRGELAGTAVLENERGFSANARELDIAAAMLALGARLFAVTVDLDALRSRAGSSRSAPGAASAHGAQAAGAVEAMGGVGAVAFLKPVEELERDAIELALRSTNWKKDEAARRLGISRASIYMKVKKYNLQKPPG